MKTFAAIYFGSYEIRMKVIELSLFFLFFFFVFEFVDSFVLLYFPSFCVLLVLEAV